MSKAATFMAGVGTGVILTIATVAGLLWAIDDTSSVPAYTRRP